MTMLKVTTTITTRVTTMITTTTRTVAELDSKMQYFAAMHDCSCLFFLKFMGIFKVIKMITVKTTTMTRRVTIMTTRITKTLSFTVFNIYS